MKIIVIGAGAMGSLFGGKLAMAGYDVTMVAVSSFTIDTINRDGIILDDEAGHHVIPVRIKRGQKKYRRRQILLFCLQKHFLPGQPWKVHSTLLGKTLIY